MGSRISLRTALALVGGVIATAAVAAPLAAQTPDARPLSPYALLDIQPAALVQPPAGAAPATPAPPAAAPQPGTGAAPEAGAQPPAAPSPAPERGGLAGGSEVVSVLGDQVPLRFIRIPPIAFLPPPFGTSGLGLKNTALVPTVRDFKVSEDDSPMPRDRVYFDFNYFNNVNGSINPRLGTDLENVRAYRETFGFEKTFLDGQASIGMRVPLDTLNTDSNTPFLGGSSTSFGDLTLIGKYVIWENHCTGDLISAGMLVSVPTGPSAYAGYGPYTTIHDTRLQPFVGYIWNFDRWFVHGFESLDLPTDSNDLTMAYSDVGVGYNLYRTEECGKLITMVVPTLEFHANIPLDHHGAFNVLDALGTPDVIDLTMGTTFGLGKRATLAVAVVTPVTGPKPFDYEVLAQLNIRFGAGSGRRTSVLGN